jgi:hypothetical protein
MSRMILEPEYGPPVHGRDGEWLGLGILLSLECWLGMALLANLWIP